jgi:hypothetical protein
MVGAKMVARFMLGSDLLLVEHTGLLLREGKASISREVSELFARLGRDAERR